MRRALVLLIAMVPAAVAGQVASTTSKHNLSVSGPGPIKATAMDEVCVFCHTPHNSSPAVPLWNQSLSQGVTYTPYSSTTLSASPGPPSGSSKLCLSCHDGTVAIGSTVNKGRIAMTGTDGQGRMTGPSVIGTDLSNDHPVSFVPVTGPQIVLPPADDPVKLDENGMVQCRSCHDPHKMETDPTVKKFIVKVNSASALCRTCHQKLYWTTNPSSHQSSTRSYPSSAGAHTGYDTVATNACESCHKPHSAAAAPRVLKGQEEATCGQCHGSSGVSTKNIAAEFTKTYTHPVYSVTPSVHDASESPASTSYRLPETQSSASRHAECADCHNPHAAYAGTATAPKGSGRVAGVWGIDSNGAQAQPSGTPPSVNEYEICYKCHGDSANKPQPSGLPWGPYPSRQHAQFNRRLQFDPANPSYHPVEAPGRSSFVPSLRPPWTTSSLIYCTDCHNNDTGPKAPTPGTGPAGPHGSSYRHLLVARYDMPSTGRNSESAAAYALCYKCHDRQNILDDRSFGKHRRHLERANAPCFVCHDPHGISASQGNAVNNARLINFDLRIVGPSSSGLLRFEHLGERSGRCYLTCHGEDHNPNEY